MTTQDKIILIETALSDIRRWLQNGWEEKKTTNQLRKKNKKW